MNTSQIYDIVSKKLNNNIQSNSFQNKNKNSNVIEYINITNPKKWIYDKYISIRDKNNIIDIDYNFYKEFNKINLTYPYDLLCHLYNNGLLNGLIYHLTKLKLKILILII